MKVFNGTINFIAGDIALPPGDGVKTIVVPIPTDGISMPVGVNGSIMHVAGNQYHDVLRQYVKANGGDLAEKTTVFVQGNQANHNGGFDNVLFVVDDLKCSLRWIINAALERAYQEGATTIALPVMRTGFNAGYGPEKTKSAIASEIWDGIYSSLNNNPLYSADITVVVYRDNDMVQLLNRIAGH